MFIPFLVLVPVARLRAAPGGFIWPVSGEVLRGFEKPSGPYGQGGHQGVDIAATPGETVVSAQDGKVQWVGELPRGRFITIAYYGGVRATYLDLDAIEVSTGQRVARGQPIATVGGHRDDSSPAPHLHFDTYRNGSPIDPMLLLRGVDTSSYVRLCPVERGDGKGTVSTGSAGESGSSNRSRHSSRLETRPEVHGIIGLISRGLEYAWGGVEAAASWTGKGCVAAWQYILYPAMSKVAAAARYVWSNRYVQAVAAGLAAAVVVVVGVVVAFILLPISAVAACIAGIAGAIACIAMAIYYAAVHPSGFSLAGCFTRSLAAGAVVAAGAASCGMLSGTFAAGWAEVGVAGTLKAAFWNGVFAAIFESGTSYAFTGHVSIRRMLVVFCVGALSGAFARVLSSGIFTERLTGLFTIGESWAGATVTGLGSQTVFVFEQLSIRFQGVLFVCKELALSLGQKLAYVTISGSFAATLDALACLAMHRPITLSGLVASFAAGAAMGCIALSFNGEGPKALLSRFSLFRRGIGERLGDLLLKIARKGMQSGIKSGLESGIKKVLNEKEAEW
jgi:hypothetical protein